MRFKSKKQRGYTIYAITGVNTISFAIDPGFTEPKNKKADTKGLLGFAMERHDHMEDERYFMPGFKVFESIISDPVEDMLLSTFDFPVQSFVWDDFTGKPGYKYTYYFYPVKGKPKNLIREKPIEITVHTEPMFSSLENDVFFNRGVASSQAYAKKFNNIPPDKITDDKKKKEAKQWLSRELDDSIIGFIRDAEKGDTLLVCYYEFHYQDIVDEFAKAIKRKVDVQIIVDGKDNKERFPLDKNMKAIKTAKIPSKNVTYRSFNKSYIMHNKFIVLLKNAGKNKPKVPTAVYTGSTNLSEGGIFGQTNVGHWIRNEKVAEAYEKYWNTLSIDPGSSPDKKKKTKMTSAKYKEANEAVSGDIAPEDIKKIPQGFTPVFSPRKTVTMLNTYAKLLDSAKRSAFITLAFGIGKVFKDELMDNKKDSHIVFMLLEKEDKPAKGKESEFVRLGIENNIYQAYGSYLAEPLYKWTRAETNPLKLGLNKHVSYIHSKFLLSDPLSGDPIVVSGSANFSEASTVKNDENMVIIRGDIRVADLYFTEFNRLFNHYYFRAVYNKMKQQKKSGAKPKGGKKKGSTNDSLFLAPDDSWLGKYKKGTYRFKRVKMFAEMEGLTDVKMLPD